MNAIKSLIAATFVIGSVTAYAEVTGAKNEISARPAAVAPASPADPKYVRDEKGMTGTDAQTTSQTPAEKTAAEINSRPSAVAPAAPADPKYRREASESGDMKTNEAQRAHRKGPGTAAADISARPTPVAPAAPADPKYVPQR
ncbi:hypothetical protein [Methyloversatilis sp.]|uniref:hypothetical protein n=1 Tax=Methyloversatilis sp. TaxID=2569862 RepID=UPI003F72B9FB